MQIARLLHIQRQRKFGKGEGRVCSFFSTIEIVLEVILATMFLPKRMAALLDKFRISYADLIVLTDVNKPPKDSTRTWFDALVKPFIRREEFTSKKT